MTTSLELRGPAASWALLGLAALVSLPGIAAQDGPANAAPVEERSVEDPIAEARRVIDIARRIEGRYRHLGPFRVTFEQAYASATFRFEDENRGTIHVVPPRRMLWVYDEPAGQRAVMDGDTWWLVDPELRQISRRDREPGETDPLVDILAGRLDLLAVFSARPSTEPAAETGQEVVELIPREPRDDMDLAVIWVDGATGDMRRVDVIDPLGNRMRFRFGRPVAETRPPEAEFRVEIPPGYTLVRE